jgi:hypothetical protein
VEISDDEDDDFEYAEVDETRFGGNDDDEEEEEDDLASALASVQLSPEKNGTQQSGRGAAADPSLRAVTQVRPSVVDDFIRNFLIKTNLRRSLDCFNTVMGMSIPLLMGSSLQLIAPLCAFLHRNGTNLSRRDNWEKNIPRLFQTFTCATRSSTNRSISAFVVDQVSPKTDPFWTLFRFATSTYNDRCTPLFLTNSLIYIYCI